MENVKKSSEIKRFTDGNLTSHLIKFAIPVLLSHLMMVLLNTVDMIVVGQRLGETGTSAVSIGGSVAMFLNAFIGGFSSAAQVIIAMMIGAGNHKRISKFISTVCGFVFVIAIASMLVMLPFTDLMLDLLNTPSEAYEGSYEYARICIFGIVPIYFYHIISALFRGLGDSKHPFIFISTACGLNIVLDVVFVLGFDMGVGGAAIATVIAQLVSVVLSVTVLVGKKEAFELTIKIKDFYTWDKQELSKFIKLAIPMAINNSAIQIAGMVINSMINDFGVTVSAFAGIRANIATTVDLILGSVATAGAMIIGQNIAAGKLKRVNGTLVRVGAITLSISAMLIVLFLACPVSVFGIFTKEKAVLELVQPYLPILIFSLVNAGIRPVTRALIDGSGNKRINLIVALLDAIVARIGLAFIFGVLLEWGYMGYWFGTTLAELVPILIGVIFYFVLVRKTLRRDINEKDLEYGK
ncbi:MAG: MATE family efflux transporter [Clostridia bacterium]|nr:MATE family efflux transporter [Clostridia bacterium]